MAMAKQNKKTVTHHEKKEKEKKRRSCGEATADTFNTVNHLSTKLLAIADGTSELQDHTQERLTSLMDKRRARMGLPSSSQTAGLLTSSVSSPSVSVDASKEVIKDLQQQLTHLTQEKQELLFKVEETLEVVEDAKHAQQEAKLQLANEQIKTLTERKRFN